jgi:hypothetical protein
MAEPKRKRKRPTETKAEREKREKRERDNAYGKADKDAYKKSHAGKTSQTKSSIDRHNKVGGLKVKKGSTMRKAQDEIDGAVEYLSLRDKQEDLASDKQEKRAGRVAKAQKRFKQKQKRKREGK